METEHVPVYVCCFSNPSHSRGRLCSRCLASTEDNSHLFLQLLEISKFWTSEVINGKVLNGLILNCIY